MALYPAKVREFLLDSPARECSNFALWSYRFSTGHIWMEQKSDRDEHKKGLVADLQQIGDAAVESSAELLAKIDRRQQAALNEMDVIPANVDATVEWKLAIGLSYGRVNDTSLQVHPLYGVPYIPASAIKGALWHYSLERAENDPPAQAKRNAVFGTAGVRGRVIFFDAFCWKKAGGRYFAQDVINKHYKDYYEQDPPLPPADYCEPEPVKFLTISKGVRFTFRMAGFRATGEQDDDSPVRTAEIWLKDMLVWYGVGAKTRVNYGRFEIP